MPTDDAAKNYKNSRRVDFIGWTQTDEIKKPNWTIWTYLYLETRELQVCRWDWRLL